MPLFELVCRDLTSSLPGPRRIYPVDRTDIRYEDGSIGPRWESFGEAFVDGSPVPETDETRFMTIPSENPAVDPHLKGPEIISTLESVGVPVSWQPQPWGLGHLQQEVVGSFFDRGR